MKNERVLICDDAEYVRKGLKIIIADLNPEDGHEVVGEASSVSEVEELIDKKGLKPTVALVDGNFPNKGDGKRAAEIIKRLSPDTIIVSISTELQTWGDYHWDKFSDADELINALNSLQH